MSEQSRHKIFDFEATPPPAAWETIAARLEDDNQHAALTSKIIQYQQTPPPACWEVIAARLEDDDQYASLAAKMNNFNVAPPLDSWQHIAASLPESTVKTMPVARKSRIIYRMAAAAVIATILIGAWMLFTRPANNTIVQNKPVAPASTEPAKINTAPVVTNPPVQKETFAAVPSATPRSNRSGYVSRAAVRSDERPLRYAVVNSIPAYRNTRIVIPSLPILDKDGVAIRDMDVLTTSNYLVVMGPNGQTTRISSKFASVIRYLNGNNTNDAEEYLDRVIKESDIWKKRFQEWRTKISQSSFIPSSANFLDIMEFKELIQEKQ